MKILLLIALFGMVLTVNRSGAQTTPRPFLHGLFTDNMVLQRDRPVPVWGWTQPGKKVTVTVADQCQSAVTGADGKWLVRIGPLPAGGPYTIAITGPRSVTLTNVLVGDVWLCSGQSNMEMGIGAAKNGSAEIARATNSMIRLFTVPKRISAEPQADVDNHWLVCSSQTVSLGYWQGFSAVGYFFGRKVQEDTGIPIGLIQAAWPGTVAEAWTSETALRTMPDFVPALTDLAGMKQVEPNTVTVLYNGMIAPILPFGIKGVVWYQGESNTGRARQYRTLLPTLIRDWRARFGAGDFPFLIVQVANFTDTPQDPTRAERAEIREAQRLTAQSVTNCGMAVTIDIGEPLDIHPKDKQEVGRRLALSALALTYGKKVMYSGPVFTSLKREGGKVRVSFYHTDGGLVAKGGKLPGFTVAGEDRRFVSADAVIDGDTVVVSSPSVAHPVAVRYGWADNPTCNLYNGAGLPAGPFCSDQD